MNNSDKFGDDVLNLLEKYCGVDKHKIMIQSLSLVFNSAEPVGVELKGVII